MGRKPVKKDRINHPETRKEWANTLLPLYMNGELIGASMDEIARHLGKSKATLYKHFATRKEILELVVSIKMTDIFQFQEILIDQTLPFTVRYNSAVMKTSEKLAGISHNFIAELKNLHPELWANINGMIQEATNWLYNFYQEGIDQDILHPFDAKVMALTDRVMIEAFSEPTFLKDNDLTLQTAIENYFLIKSQGIFKIKP